MAKEGQTSEEGRQMADEFPDRIDFHYVKSNDFRVVHCDGVWGGTTPRGYLTMSVYSERSPIPQKLTHEVTQEGWVGTEIERDSKGGIIREVGVEIIMDLEIARSVLTWLQTHVENLTNQHGKDRRKLSG